MKYSKDKISMRQACIILLLALGAPSLRVIPNYIAREVGKAGWVSAILGIIPGIFIIMILSKLLLRRKGGLYEAYEDIFGKKLNKIITIFIAIWSIFLAALYLRMFGERFSNTILFESNIGVLMAIMMIFIWFLVNQKIDVIGRMSEILIYFFGIIILLVFITTFSQIEIKNIWPVTFYDIPFIVKGILPLTSLSFYITAIMFLGDRISDLKNFKKNGIEIIIIFSIFSVILLLSTTGLFGYKLNGQILFPYFATLKNVRILNVVERIESLFISIWVGADAIIIALFSLISINLTKKIIIKEKLSNKSWIILIIIFLIAINFAPNAYEAEEIAKKYIGPINNIIFGIFPLIVLIIGKIRRVL